VKAKPTPAPAPHGPLFAANKPVSPPKWGRPNEQTVFFWQLTPAARPDRRREQVAEARYASKLAKRPEDLTPEERMFAHEHY
jgi:hypothetical protein